MSMSMSTTPSVTPSVTPSTTPSSSRPALVELDHHNFDREVLAAELPVLVDFWAVWCAPCRAIAPHVEALAQQYAGRVRVGKLDIDGNPEVAARFDVRAAPTLLMFKNGEVVGQIVGAVPRAKLEALITRAL